MQRTRLVAEVVESHARLVVVRAPAGYGKTLLMAQCATAVDTPVAWVSLDAADNNPSTLIADITTALSRVTSVGRASGPGAIPRLIHELVHGPPVMLFLDDLHAVRSPAAVEVLMELGCYLPGHTRLVVAGREPPCFPLARLRTTGALLELGPEDLGLDRAEVDELMRVCGVSLEPATLEMLYTQTEGWVTGLTLAFATAHKSEDPERAAREFGGGNRALYEYITSEVIAPQPPDRSSFLTQSSILERFSAPLCDATLGRTDSAMVIEKLERSAGFIVALDARQVWFRYHHLLAEVLQIRLSRTEPGLAATLHRAASEWHERRGLLAEAVEHAVQESDRDHAATLLGQHARELFDNGGQALLIRWIQSFSDAELSAYPAVAAAASWVMGQLGDRARARHYMTLLENTTFNKSAVDLLKAAFAWEGVSQMRALAEVAYGLEPAASTAHEQAALYVGANHLLRGRFDAARQLLEEAAAIDDAGANCALFATGLLALLHLESQRFDLAHVRVDQGLGIIRRIGLDGYMSSGACLAVAACLCLRESNRDGAQEYLDAATSLLPTARATPWWSILLGILCARASLGLGQTQQAQTLVLDAERELAHYPDSGMLSHWLAREQRALHAAWGGFGILGEPLTEAELRVLELAPTYLTLEEIGRRLCISRNTVKTHLKMIYSKLNVSSRGEAVERAQAMGLLGHHPARIPKRPAA